jgi:uncharacterized protein (TIGR00369 family)
VRSREISLAPCAFARVDKVRLSQCEARLDKRSCNKLSAPGRPADLPVNLFEDIASGLSGLEQLQALIRSQRRPGIAESLDFRISEASDDFAALTATPGLHVYNADGTVQGGFAATLLDIACGSAVHSKLSASQGARTLELKIAFHKGMTAETGPVRAEGWIVTMGRRAAFTEGRLTDAGRAAPGLGNVHVTGIRPIAARAMASSGCTPVPDRARLAMPEADLGPSLSHIMLEFAFHHGIHNRIAISSSKTPAACSRRLCVAHKKDRTPQLTAMVLAYMFCYSREPATGPAGESPSAR